MSETPAAFKISGKNILKIFFSISLLAFFLYKTGIDKTFQELSEANLWYVPLGIAIYLGSQWVSAHRWRILAVPMGFPLSIREFYDYYLMGMFFSLFLPGSIGGDVLRVIYLAKSVARKKRDALLTILAERGIGLLTILLIVGVLCLTPDALPLPPEIRSTMIAVMIASLITYGMVNLVPMQRIAEKWPALRLIASAERYWKDLPLLFKSIGLSTIVHSCMVLIHYFIATALGMKVSVIYLALAYGVVSLASVIPISFNGIGVREGMYMFIFKQVGIADHTGLAFGLYWFAVSAITSLFGGLILLKGHYKTPMITAEDFTTTDLAPANESNPSESDPSQSVKDNPANALNI